MNHQNTMHLNISIVQVCNSERPPSLSGGSRRTCFTCLSPKCNDCFKPNTMLHSVMFCTAVSHIVIHCSTMLQNVTHWCLSPKCNGCFKPNFQFTDKNAQKSQSLNGKGIWETLAGDKYNILS